MKDSYIANKGSRFVGFLNAVMGKRIDTGEKTDISDFDKLTYKFSLMACFVCAHAWQVAKWSSIREATSFLDDTKMSFFSRFTFAAEYKDLFVTKKQNAE